MPLSTSWCCPWSIDHEPIEKESGQQSHRVPAMTITESVDAKAYRQGQCVHLSKYRAAPKSTQASRAPGRQGCSPPAGTWCSAGPAAGRRAPSGALRAPAAPRSLPNRRRCRRPCSPTGAPAGTTALGNPDAIPAASLHCCLMLLQSEVWSRACLHPVQV